MSDRIPHAACVKAYLHAQYVKRREKHAKWCRDRDDRLRKAKGDAKPSTKKADPKDDDDRLAKALKVLETEKETPPCSSSPRSSGSSSRKAVRWER